jgi:hypothetical protein
MGFPQRCEFVGASAIPVFHLAVVFEEAHVECNRGFGEQHAWAVTDHFSH